MNKTANSIETVMSGFANGISTQLAQKQLEEGSDAKLSNYEKAEIINNAAHHFGAIS